MLILAVDTSGPSCSVALGDERLMRYEAVCTNKLTHSVSLMSMVEEALQKGGAALEEVDFLCAVTGPGSFTGVRIGVSCVKGLALAQGKKVIGVDALEALAIGADISPKIVCPIRDARVNQVYGTAFRGGRRLMDDEVLKLPEYLNRIVKMDGDFLFVGDGVRAYRGQIEDALGLRACFAPVHLNDLKAGSAVAAAVKLTDRAMDADMLVPLYLRRPQAERERLAREEKGE